MVNTKIYYYLVLLLLTAKAYSFHYSSSNKRSLSIPHVLTIKQNDFLPVGQKFDRINKLYLIDPSALEATTSAAASAISSGSTSNILDNGNFVEMYSAMEQSFFRTITFRAFGSFLGDTFAITFSFKE
jgi:beta-N-acetylglucosaminidase